MSSVTANDMNGSETSAAERIESSVPEETDVCPSVYCPPDRLHERFGLWEGPRMVEEDIYARPPRYNLPEAPFRGNALWLDDERWLAVLLGPGYRPRPNEPLWLVRMTPRYVFREMVYDATCRQLYPFRFLSRLVERVMSPSTCEFPPLARLSVGVHVHHYLYVGARQLDLPTCHCLAPEVPETKQQIQKDYERRFYGFDKHNNRYPLMGAFRGLPDRMPYRGPHLRLVLQVCRRSAAAEEVRRTRDSDVRSPPDLAPWPKARAYLYPGPLWRGSRVPYNPPEYRWVAARD
ncbi:hypothetical protein Emed_007041 [Eimeria media]